MKGKAKIIVILSDTEASNVLWVRKSFLQLSDPDINNETLKGEDY